MHLKCCRICRGRLKTIINLGRIALVGEFLKMPDLKSNRYEINLCYCKKCKHVQISEHINPNKLFRKYLWETGISSSNLDIISKMIKKLKTFKINKFSKVFEIACNDGSFLKALNEKLGCMMVGIDPAKNLSQKNQNKNIHRITNYFTEKQSILIKKKYGKFDYIFARNVLAHVKNPNDLFQGVKKIISDTGIFILEAPSLLNIIKDNQYDNIFHEHIGFHSIKSVIDLAKINKFKLFDVEYIESQGGSLRYYLSNDIFLKSTKKVKYFLSLEKKYGLFRNQELQKFKLKINHHRKSLYNLINKIKKEGNKISAYGASGKGLALLQYCKINNNFIDYIFDKSKLKQKKYTPGTYIQVKNPKLIKNLEVDYLLLLTWNLKKEIFRQEKNFINNGGKFILPFKKPTVINK